MNVHGLESRKLNQNSIMKGFLLERAVTVPRATLETSPCCAVEGLTPWGC